MGLMIISPAGPPSRRDPFCVICPHRYPRSCLLVEGHLLAFCIGSSLSLYSLSCLVSHDPLGRTGWKRKEMSLSQRLVLILSAPFRSPLSLEAPGPACMEHEGAEHGDGAWRWQERFSRLGGARQKRSQRGLGGCVPTALNKRSESSFPFPLCPSGPRRAMGETPCKHVARG